MNPEANEVKANEVKLMTRAQETDALAGTASSPVLARIPVKTQGSLLRMFADPYLLEKEERGELVRGLRECVLANPEVSELRVLYGMALCVDYKVHDAIEELREGVRLAPENFIAHLKMGELWMRLRVIEKAEEHTRQAALLAQNMMQSELARRQAADDSHAHAQRTSAAATAIRVRGIWSPSSASSGNATRPKVKRWLRRTFSRCAARRSALGAL